MGLLYMYGEWNDCEACIFYSFKILKKNWVLDFFKCYVEFSLIHTGSKEYIYICIYKSPRSVYFSLVITIDYNW